MPVAWRIVKESRVSTAFSGEGASRYGGRWNSRGTAVVYASSSQALAALEILVHLNPPLYFHYLAFKIEYPDRVAETLTRLPPGWRNEPPGSASQILGDKWAAEARSAVLLVPSSIVPEETNCLLNPAHADFSSLKIAAPRPFSIDARLIRD